MLKHSHSPEIWLCCLLLTLSSVMCWAQIDPIAPLTENLKTNVVAIRATLDGTEEKGFGFITAEQNGRLYIATAAHVVRGPDKSKTAEKIRVKFLNDLRWFDASFVYHWDNEDLALLELNKPIALAWQPNCADLNPGSSRKVRFIGLNANEPRWVDPGLDGNIFGDSEALLEFSINTIRPGTSGAPLITERGIVGMITQDEGAISTALKITQIKKLFSGGGQYPYFGLQAWGGGLPAQTETNNNTSRPPVQPQNNPYHMVEVEGCANEQGNDCGEGYRVITFSISKYEVTQAQWRKVMGNDPPELAFPGCDECPVENVSWNDIQEFLRKLNAQTGKNYRLPNFQEWGYAARGGKLSQRYKYTGGNDLSDVAWYVDNSSKQTHPVGKKSPNELGLYDMNGNVSEWCGYYLKESKPVGLPDVRRESYLGGNWGSASNEFNHQTIAPSWTRSQYVGFRLAL